MISPQLRALHEDNRISWNAATIAHNSHKGDQIRFFQEGGDTLFPEDVELLGELTGKRVLHLQCNCGQDTLSLARRGATVTGVDISDQAVDFARNLSVRTGIPAEFHRADLYDWLITHREAGEPFDIVYSSYGALQYLSSLQLWTRLITDILRPGGSVILIDFHPVLHMFDSRGKLQNPYTASGRPSTQQCGVSDYVQQAGVGLAEDRYEAGIQNFANPYPQHVFHWGLGELTEALLDQGLSIEVLREYPHGNGHRYFDDSTPTRSRQFLPPSDLPPIPMMFGLRARR